MNPWPLRPSGFSYICSANQGSMALPMVYPSKSKQLESRKEGRLSLPVRGEPITSSFFGWISKMVKHWWYITDLNGPSDKCYLPPSAEQKCFLLQVLSPQTTM